MKLYTYKCLFLIIISVSSLYVSGKEEYKFGFGSCIEQNYPQPIWSAIEKENIDSFIFLGDNVYGDEPSEGIQKLKMAYQKQKDVLPEWLNKKQIYAIWDDHDYGLNDGGSGFELRKESQELYLDFWNIPIGDDRRKRSGIYFNKMKHIDDLKVHLIGLDTRFFRSDLLGIKLFHKPNTAKDATILGKEQWEWLQEVIRVDADVIILLSSIQVLAENHPFEKWSLFPNEKLKLLDLINSSNIPTLIISGDRHKGGIYKKNNINEITSSSLNKPVSVNKLFKETDPLMIGKIYNKENYGIIEINTQKKIIKFSLKDINGNLIQNGDIKLK